MTSGDHASWVVDATSKVIPRFSCSVLTPASTVLGAWLVGEFHFFLSAAGNFRDDIRLQGQSGTHQVAGANMTIPG